eukprot:scaffold35528_cov101-Isochrysis_galbana.AAC.3
MHLWLRSRSGAERPTVADDTRRYLCRDVRSTKAHAKCRRKKTCADLYTQGYKKENLSVRCASGRMRQDTLLSSGRQASPPLPPPPFLSFPPVRDLLSQDLRFTYAAVGGGWALCSIYIGPGWGYGGGPRRGVGRCVWVAFHSRGRGGPNWNWLVRVRASRQSQSPISCPWSGSPV